MRRLVAFIACVANLLLLDAVTKELSFGLLRGKTPFTVIPGFFDFAYVENRGCAWGMFQGGVWPLAAVGIVMLALIIWKRKAFFSGCRFPFLTECLLCAGIIGNLIDRVFRGFVIDMIDVHWGAHHFPCFNVADSCICIAAGLLLLFQRPKPAADK